jgi:hypothetical protein
MGTVDSVSCRKVSCVNAIPQSLSAEQLCLDHFLDEAFRRTDQALKRCRAGELIDSKSVEHLLGDALAIVSNLDEEPAERNADQRDRMLELLLILANLHEYVAHISTQTVRPA